MPNLRFYQVAHSLSLDAPEPPVIAALRDLAQKELKKSVSVRIFQIHRELSARAQDVEETGRSILKRLGTEKDGSLTISRDSENWDAWIAEYNELMNTEFEYDKTLRLSELGDTVKAETLAQLGAVLELDE